MGMGTGTHRDFAGSAIDAFEWLLRESRHAPRMMCRFIAALPGERA